MIIKRVLWLLFCIGLILLSVHGATASLSDGLISFYHFENNTNDFLGVNDLSNSGASLVSGISGSGYLFSPNDFLNDSSPVMSINSSSFSSQAWFKTSYGVTQSIYSLRASGAAVPYTDLYLNASGNLIFRFSSSALQLDSVVSNNSFNDGLWHHVVVVKNSSGAVNGSIWVDGVVQNLSVLSSTAVSIVFDVATLRIGEVSTAIPDHPFNGTLDDIGFWSKELSLSERGFLFNGTVFNAFEVVSGSQINNFSVSNNFGSDSTTNGSAIIRSLFGEFVQVNFSSTKFFNTSSVVNASGLVQLANFSNVSDYKLFFGAGKNTSGGLNIFSINISSSLNGFMSSKSTTNGSLFFGLDQDVSYNVSFMSGVYQVLRASFVNGSLVGEVNSSIYNFTAFQNNSLHITFLDSSSLLLFNFSNVSISLIGSSAQTSFTTSGYLNFSGLLADEYTLFYSATGYETGKYVLTLANNSVRSINLFLQNDSLASLVLITVSDRFGSEVSGAEVIVQKWVNDSWITDQIVITDFQGRSEAYYVLSTVFYNHVLRKSGIIYFGVINDDANKKLIFAEDVTNGINFKVDLLGGSLLADYYNASSSVTTVLSYVNTSNVTGYFRYFWSTTDNVNVSGCLKVYKGGGQTLLYNNCSVTSTGTKFYYVNQSVGTSVYSAGGSINGFVSDGMSLLLGVRASIDWGVTGYILAFFLVVVAFFAFLSNPTISLLVGTSVFVLFALFGVIFKNTSAVDYAVFICLLAVAFLIARVKSEGGVNG